MEPDGQTYILPHPTVARVIMTAGGVFALVMLPYELWGGVWPVSLLTPFFGFIMLGGMSVGAAFLYGGLVAPSGKMRFSSGMIEVIQTFLWGASRTVIRMDDIDRFAVEESFSSDGPNDWYAVIHLKGRKPLSSRPLSTKQAAENQLEEFRRLLAA
jgi:hypothetical protein